MPDSDLATQVERTYARFDRHHPDDRIRLFAAVADHLGAQRVIYPGSYVDIAPSVHHPDVIYIDLDRRAARFFAQIDDVAALIEGKRRAAVETVAGAARFTFHQLDYRHQLPLPPGSFDLLISMYAGFVSEYCTEHLRPGGHLLVNPSHGDASMAAIDPRYQLAAVFERQPDRYRVRTDDLDRYLVPKRGTPATGSELHQRGRGIAYTRSPYAYLFRVDRR